MKAKGSFLNGLKAHAVEIAFGGTAFLCVLGLCLWMALRPKEQAKSADIVDHGQIVMTLDLHEEKLIEVPSKHGHVDVRVKNGRVSVVYSPCPSQYCVHQGEKDKDGESIVCAYEGISVFLHGDSGIYEVSV